MTYNAPQQVFLLTDWDGRAAVRRLLIVSCSQRKRAGAGEQAAIDRYDGQSFRVLHGYLRATGDMQLDVHILSAKYGLISADRPIPWYDQKMTRQRATELRDSVDAGLREIVDTTQYESIFVACGAIYRVALGNALENVDADISTSTGPIGVQLSQLKRWLYRTDPPLSLPRLIVSSATDQRVLQAVTNPAPDDILLRARTALMIDPDGATRFSVWRADVDGQPVAVKWLLHQLTGLPLKAFTSQTAVRQLRRMGFEVRGS